MQRETAITNRKDLKSARVSGKGVVAMTREDLRGIIEGISDEQLKKILDINSTDVGKARNGAEDLKKELESANANIEGLTSEISVLKEAQCEAEEMKIKVGELQKIIDDRRIEDEKAARDAELQSRFENATNGMEFLNEFTRNGVFAQFSEALEAEENRSKSDAEIFQSLTADVGNLFVSDNGIPTVLASTTGFGADLSMGDVREIMGLSRE